MGLGDVLFGRKRLKQPAEERLFALSTAQVTLEVELGLRFAGRGAVCVKPLSAGAFSETSKDLDELLAVALRDSSGKTERSADTYGFEWLVISTPALEDAVATAHLVASELQSRGFGEQLLAAVFRFEGPSNPVFWVYGYKQGAFWPFIPVGGNHERDNATELELKAKLEPELPIEPDLSRWFGLFGAPL